MDRQPAEQAPENYWTTLPLFTQPAPDEGEGRYASPSRTTQQQQRRHHHHQVQQQHEHHQQQHQHQQRYPPWFPQPIVPQVSWINEPSEALYPPQPISLPGGSSSGGRPEPSQRPLGTSPIDNPGLTSSEQDEYGRFICKYPECDAKPEDRIFTRKSDWRRHFDKHTRPYRCTHDACKDLAGFGWVGGLNRHLEELHNSKAQHKCPYMDCKRHINGFSRSTNLKNHMRKVHNIGSDSGVVSETADNSGAEHESPPPQQRFPKRPRPTTTTTTTTTSTTSTTSGTQRTRDQILKEIGEVEREVGRRDGELREARQRKVDVLVRLERLRAELEDGRFPTSSFATSDSASAFVASPPPPPPPPLPPPPLPPRPSPIQPVVLPGFCFSSSACSPPTPPAEGGRGGGGYYYTAASMSLPPPSPLVGGDVVGGDMVSGIVGVGGNSSVEGDMNGDGESSGGGGGGWWTSTNLA